MGYNAISYSVFNKSTVSKILAFVAFESNIAEVKHIIRFQILRIGNIRIRLIVHVGDGNNIFFAVCKIVLLGYFLIQFIKLTLFPCKSIVSCKRLGTA